MKEKSCNIDNEKDKVPYSGCLFFASNSLARYTTNLAEIAFRPLGITAPSAYIVMMVLESPGINSTDLAKKMMLKPSTVTRFVDRLIKSNHLKKVIESKYSYIYPTEFAISEKHKFEMCSNNLIEMYEKVFAGEELCNLTKTSFNATQKIKEYLED